MSASGFTRLEFGGEDRDFKLGLAELRRLQELTGRGPARVLSDLRLGDWEIDDPRHVLRLGLEGAGVEPKDATALVKRYVDEARRWLSTARNISMLVLAEALEGPEEDLPGKSSPQAGTT